MTNIIPFAPNNEREAQMSYFEPIPANFNEKESAIECESLKSVDSNTSEEEDDYGKINLKVRENNKLT